MGTSTLKCTGCKAFPMVVASGTVMCPRCRVTATSMKDWNKFMAPTGILELIEKLERPLAVLKAVAVYTDDKGLRALAATTLNSMGELEFSEVITDRAEAEEYTKKLKETIGG